MGPPSTVRRAAAPAALAKYVTARLSDAPRDGALGTGFSPRAAVESDRRAGLTGTTGSKRRRKS
jgi:hypothetical protein